MIKSLLVYILNVYNKKKYVFLTWVNKIFWFKYLNLKEKNSIISI
jgi:hypothetical protein